MKYESHVGELLESISKAIVADNSFKNTPIYYDFIEVDENNLPPSCIIYKPLEWVWNSDYCANEMQLDIVLLITTEERREGIVGQLFMFREKLKEIIDEFILNTTYDIQFLEGSPVEGFKYNREGQDSYKDTKQLFTSMVILRYITRY